MQWDVRAVKKKNAGHAVKICHAKNMQNASPHGEKSYNNLWYNIY